MRYWQIRFGQGLVVFLMAAVTAQAQEYLPPGMEAPGPPGQPAGTPARPPGSGLQAESLPGELAEDIAPAPAEASLGPTPVSDVRFLMDTLGLKNLFGDSGIRTFGWVEGGYTGASSGSGLLSVEPRQNRFGNEFLLNQIGLVIQKPLKQDRFDIGFNVRYFAGADAALGQPMGGIDDPAGNSHFSHDFRDLYLSAHLPILTEGGMDFKIGRMNTIIGYNGFLAPYRPFYSSDYQFFYSQDGAFTGFLTNLHVTKRLDIWNGMTLGANTFFTKRSDDSFCYIGQVNYWLTDEQRTRLTGSVYTGPNAIFAAPGLAGDLQHHRRAPRPAELERALHPDRPVQHGLGYQYPGRHRLLVWPVHHRHLSPDPRSSTSRAVANGSTTSRGLEPGSTPTMPR